MVIELTDVRPLPDELRITGRRAHPAVLCVNGFLELATAPLLRAAIRALPAGAAVRLDAAGLEFVDCAGLGVLVEASRELRQDGGRLEIERASPALRRVCGLVGCDEILHLDQPCTAA